MKFAKHVAVALVVGLYMPLLAANVPDPTVRTEDAIRYRRAAMVMIKWHYDRLLQQARGGVALDRDDAERNAYLLDALSKNMAEGFAAVSHEGDTKASAAIWADRKKFREMVERFQGDAASLRELASHGDATTVKSQLDRMARTCKSCHDEFKKS